MRGVLLFIILSEAQHFLQKCWAQSKDLWFFFCQKRARLFRLPHHQQKQTTLYIGVTNDLQRRIWEHRNKLIAGFSADYNLSRLLYYETYPDARSAIAREKQLKGWRREKKTKLIETMNPHWHDLSIELFEQVIRGPSAPLRFAQDDSERGFRPT